MCYDVQYIYYLQTLRAKTAVSVVKWTCVHVVCLSLASDQTAAAVLYGSERASDTTPSVFVFRGNCILSLSCTVVMLKQVRLSLRKINHVKLAVVSHVVMHVEKKKKRGKLKR